MDKIRLAFTTAGLGLLILFILLMLSVKYDLLPVLKIETAPIEGKNMHGEFYETVVSDKSIINIEGKLYIYWIDSVGSYWFDGLHAYQIEVGVIDADNGFSAVEFPRDKPNFANGRSVVLNPRTSFGDSIKVEKIMHKDGW